MGAREFLGRTLSQIGAEKRELLARDAETRKYIERSNIEFSADEAYADYFADEIAKKIPPPPYTKENAGAVFAALRNLESTIPTPAQMRDILIEKRNALKRRKDAYESGGSSHEQSDPHPHGIEEETHDAESVIPPHPEIEDAKSLDEYHADRQQELMAELRAELHLAQEAAAHHAIEAELREIKAQIKVLAMQNAARMATHDAHGAVAHAEAGHHLPHEIAHGDAHGHEEHEKPAPMSDTERRKKIAELEAQRSRLGTKAMELNDIKRYTSQPKNRKGQKEKLEKNFLVGEYLRQESAINKQIMALKWAAHAERTARRRGEARYEAAEGEGHTPHEGDQVPRETFEGEWVTADSGREYTRIENALDFDTFKDANKIREEMRGKLIADERIKVIAALRAAGVVIPDDIMAMARGDASRSAIGEAQRRMAAHAEAPGSSRDEDDGMSFPEELELRGVMQELMGRWFANGFKGYDRLTRSLNNFIRAHGTINNPEIPQALYAQVLVAAEGDGSKTGVRLTADQNEKLTALFQSKLDIDGKTPVDKLRSMLAQLPKLIEKTKNDRRMRVALREIFGNDDQVANKYLNEVKKRANKLKAYANVYAT